jgi:predicted nuclease of predicted toxin-antitoxin system
MQPINKIGLPALLVSFFLCATSAEAFDLNGAWANNTDVCTKIFVKNKNRISITRDSDMYGSGFIVEGDKIRGKMASCAIKTRKEDAGTLNIVAVCSTDIALSTVQFMLKTDGEDSVTRQYPGLPEMSVSYVRCAFK